MKIIIGVLSFDGGGYDKMVEACRETCYSDLPENVKVFYLYGHRPGYPIPHTYTVANDCFYNNSPESRGRCLDKTMAFFEHCLKNEDFDFILRANCGSYIDIDKLLSLIEGSSHVDKQNTYFGSVVAHTGTITGSAYLLSKDVVELLVANKDNLLYEQHPNFVADDVSLGNFIIDHSGIPVSVAPISSMPGLNFSEIKDHDFIDDQYHYYFKHSIDPRCLYAVHDKLGYNMETRVRT